MPNPLAIGLAINPGYADQNAPSAGELQALGTRWVRFLLSNRIGANDHVQNFDSGQNGELDRLLARLDGTGVQVLALINHETFSISPGEMRADWNGTIQRVAGIAERVARFYGSRIAAIEVLNEPDNWDPGTDFHRFGAQEYGALLRETVQRVKAVNPSLAVISGGLISPLTIYLRDMLAAAGIALDGVGWHGYLRSAKGFPSPDWGGPVYGQDLEAALREVRAVAGVPIWITEIGVSLDQIGGESAAAEYVRQALTAVYDVGSDVASHVFWFTYRFPATPHEPGRDYGLVSPDGARRPAWSAFAGETRRIGGLPPRLPLPPSLTGVELAPATMTAGQVLNVSITVKNDSDDPLLTQDPPPGFVYEEGDSFESRGFTEQPGAVRVAVDFDGHDGLDHPYRWGLGRTLQPGETVTVTGGIRLRTPQSRTYYAGLVREHIAWLVSRQGMQTIQVGTTGPTRDELQRQISALQAQISQLQARITQTRQESERLTAAVAEIKRLIQ
ncbi:MAG: hypothetical protein HZB53_05555 [Chloroflexi bacterium]|nr:hypothetical protein [Chloroflexota bacterium]